MDIPDIFDVDKAESRIVYVLTSCSYTDYKELDRICRERTDAARKAKAMSDSQRTHRANFNTAVSCPATVQGQWHAPPCACPQYRGAGYKGGKDCPCVTNGAWEVFADKSKKEKSQNWGYCPPIGLDPRCLIRPRNKSLLNSMRPTGDPYFAQESKPSCVDVYKAPILLKGGFTFDDWLNTVGQREPPPALRNTCIPSLASWCKPVAVDCQPLTYSLIPFQRQICL
ncbi:hypothetical protein PoB_002282300 [Plakobranchus ocellatus]|uniref:DUF4789 domain-containing protein n=1 Tax=Plakobranchus ocellatus TaxID=259542 RepID=A0AAV3ZNA7_9GAST|nr:hypothetical protein PoB_002282300 [Plakobranchus ocellatus]